MKNLHVGALVLATVAWATGTAGQDITIRLANGTESEEAARRQLQAIMTRFDVTPWLFTADVVIERGAIPHSHPVLTLNTRDLDNDTAKLSTFLHEQIHWLVYADSNGTAAAIRELQARYPAVPVGRPDGARSEFSTYLHLIVCWLELDAMTHFVGADAARALLADQRFYRWIYERVLTETQEIGNIIRRHGLLIDNPPVLDRDRPNKPIKLSAPFAW